MADLLTVGSYAFFAPGVVVTGWDPGLPTPLDFAVNEWEANPSARSWGYVTMHGIATRTLSVLIDAATEAEARGQVALITAECRPGATLTWQPEGQASAVTCTVLSAIVDPEMETRFMATTGQIAVTITFRTTPYWLGPEVEVIPTITAAGTPWTADISDVPGDVPALTKLRLTHEQATTMHAVGLRSAASLGFDPIADYSGATDALGYGGAVAELDATTSYAAIASDPALDPIDVAANLGDHLVFARVKTDATTPTNASVRFVSSVQGSIGDAFAISGSPVTIPASGYNVLSLGVATIPAGRVEAGVTGTKYGSLVKTGFTTGTPVFQWVATLGHNQTFKPTVTGKITTAAVSLRVTGGTGTAYISILRGSTPLCAPVPVTVTSTGTNVAAQLRTVSVGDIEVTAGETLTLKTTGTTNVHVGVFTAGGYADGALNGSALDDYFVIGQNPLVTLGCTLTAQAKVASESSKHVSLDSLAFVPADECAVMTTGTFAAGQGVCIDYLGDAIDHDVYIADATTTGISLIGTTTPYGGPLMLRPGDNTLVGMAATPAGAAPGDPSLVVTYRPRYLTPYTGE